MSTIRGTGVRTVADIVQVVTQCSTAEANAAELQICKSPGAISTLAMACGISKSAIGLGGTLTVAGASGGSLILGGVVLTGAGLLGAKRFFKSIVDQVTENLNGALDGQ